MNFEEFVLYIISPIVIGIAIGLIIISAINLNKIFKRKEAELK